MHNDITTSIALTKWLDAQGITIEVDEFAPKVWHYEPPEPPPPDYGEGPMDYYDVGSHPMIADLEPCCPYFGPGGDGNLLKALRALTDKFGPWLEIKRNDYKHMGALQPCRWWWMEDLCRAPKAKGEGKSDGEALRDLLVKLMEEK